ncbi:DEAD/DEAH box helicase family protein [Bergeriella denitrificans]|uniref:Type III restriction enzyme n=1 Tax=Bergeriella denitrificans TaxID=494 RepID=A0A378UHP3_BERDE|nr:DEAD/DEAH box helicase family protein [Bergeriella denitrificans]STZ76209.1 type III restriction enzyme [Bergeriella denitrificans]
MKLNFEQLDYQRAAIDAVLNVFSGSLKMQPETVFHQNGGAVVGNRRFISHDEMAENLRAVQTANGIAPSDLGAQGLNFSVEMETGTGKTYVYLRTIYELHKQYGWLKFVIVVPNVAIREGVMQTLRATKAHFDDAFDNEVVIAHEYDSSRLNDLKTFAESNQIHVLVMTIQAFNKDSNIINQVREQGFAPVEWLAHTQPVVILDEPQNFESELSRESIEKLNPLFTLRYSATHKNPYNPVYSLNPVQAYQMGLVKQIVVDSVTAKGAEQGAYVRLLEVKPAKKSISAKVELLVRNPKNGEIAKKAVSVKAGDDLFAKSNENGLYRDGYLVDEIFSDGLDWQMGLSNGTIVGQFQNDSAVQDEIMKRQIFQTVEEHIRKERKLKPKGIKVLSLFFIDKVEHYRGANGEDGKFKTWFEEAYRHYYGGENPEDAHGGYFSQDKGRLKNTGGNTQADNETYQLIMKDKEKLLSFDSELRFIFSHSALREGWDNPNVFQICTLNETVSTAKKRQEIGRGLRLPVKQDGSRHREIGDNVLTVIANESYEQFARLLQQEIADDCGVEFANGGAKPKRARAVMKTRDDFSADPLFQEIWQKINRQTRYRVHFSTQELIEKAAQNIANLPEIAKPHIASEKVKLQISRTFGVETEFARSEKAFALPQEVEIPDVLSEIQQRTELTRQTIAQILKQSGKINQIANHPQKFIETAAKEIQTALQELMVNGIEYELIEQPVYEMREISAEFYQNEHSFHVTKPEKTIYQAGLIDLDSDTEKQFAQACQSHEAAENHAVAFYFKLPNKFKIRTPAGFYNPDWAVVMNESERVYFVAETKNTGTGSVDLRGLRTSEQLKIAYAKKHFAQLDGVEYRVVQKVDELVSDRYSHLK